MRFKLRQMEVFRAVMISGSVSGAARLLYVSQPAVSKLLAHTETNLGLKLFNRSSGRLTPTKIALSLYEEVSHVYDAAARVDAFVENALRGPSGSVNVICSPSLGLSVVPRLIAEFLQAHPQVTIRFHTTLIQDMQTELLSGKADLAICVLPIEAQHLKSEKLMQGQMVCAIPDGHQLCEHDVISLSQLEHEKLVLYSRSIPFGNMQVAAFERYGCNVLRTVEVPRAELACSLVRQGVGIAIIDQFSVEGNPWHGVTIRPLKEEIPISVSLVRSVFTKPDAAADQFVELVQRRLSEQYYIKL
ncbi:LysR family transcriptional regulator [Alcaligenaceae bacterium]|nr:LysR family transcriptional regulator [Alcaligenaceae bacterium]